MGDSKISSFTRSSSKKQILELGKKLDKKDLEISNLKVENLELKKNLEEERSELTRVKEELVEKQKEVDLMKGNLHSPYIE